MNKQEVIKRVARRIKDKGFRKPIAMPKRSFTITDEDGLSKTFSVKPSEREVMYTKEDVGVILSEMLDLIVECIRTGEEISIPGFGSFKTAYRGARNIINISTGESSIAAGKYYARFTPGAAMRRAAFMYDPNSNGDTDSIVDYGDEEDETSEG